MQTAIKTIFTVGLSLLVSAWVAYPQPPTAPEAGKAPGGKGGPGGAKGKGKGKSLPEGPTPRMADGKPDLSGNWEPNAIQQNVNLAGAMETAGTPIPFQPWAKIVSEKHRADVSKDDPEALCLPPGVPRMNTTPYPWTFVQTPKLLTIVYEGGAHVWRKVFLDGRAHDPNAVETWLGDSTGHWEGDTLVIETVGQTDKSWLDEGGVPHSNDMKVTERITRSDLAHLEIVNIIDDPKTFTKTWSFTTHPTLLAGELIEYICQENNKDVQHLVGK
ncbi:MAG: hypothetical protein ABI824_15990 [Acidobacteriota bacterium]